MTTNIIEPVITSDGRVACPTCNEIGSLRYAYDTPSYCELVVRDGQVVATTPDEDLSESNNFRLFCTKCGETWETWASMLFRLSGNST